MNAPTIEPYRYYTVTVAGPDGVTKTTAYVKQVADGLVWFVVNGFPCDPVGVGEILEAVPVRE